jgi:hypothetical protein
MVLIMVLLRFYKKKYFLSNPAMELRDPVIRRRVGLGPEGKELEAAGAELHRFCGMSQNAFCQSSKESSSL